MWCAYHYAASFDIALLVPLSNAIDPTDEAIVLVVPAPENDNWYSNSFHYSLTQTLNKLADPIASPWLAKTVILVSPSKSEGSQDSSSLEDTVSAFLDSYLGSKSTSMNAAIAPLPPRYSQAILRNMIVVELKDESITSSRQGSNTPPTSNLSILPQGKRGALPNLDMVTLIGKLFRQSTFLNTQVNPASTFLAHGYTEQSQSMKAMIQKRLIPEKPTKFEKKTQIWANQMADLGLFAYTLAAGPYPPHWSALDRGIDSVTIELKFQGIYRRDPSLETVLILENVVRALSNLHERLHHSFVLYWLPSPERFVSHMEYFLPTVLVLLPLATRAFGMIFLGELTSLNLTVIGKSLLLSLCVVGLMGIVSLLGPSDDDDTRWTNRCLSILYCVVVALVRRMRQVNDTQEEAKRSAQSLQFAACATAAYILVPIAFCHSALVYVPAMILVPLLAFVDYSQFQSNHKTFMTKMKRFLLIDLCLLSVPPVVMVPRFFPTYTVFVKYAYVPMHVQLVLLVLL